jgi:hypothetical protein
LPHAISVRGLANCSSSRPPVGEEHPDRPLAHAADELERAEHLVALER